MSEPVVRDYSFTVRLSADERAELEALAGRWGLDRSATVRRALQALAGSERLPARGDFVCDGVRFPVSFKEGQ